MFPNKMDVRKKAMAAMMKEGGPSGMMMKKKPMMKPMLPQMEGSPMEEGAEAPELEAKEDGQEGFEQMMVSPEEKKMLLEMRGESEGGGMMAPKPKGY